MRENYECLECFISDICVCVSMFAKALKYD